MEEIDIEIEEDAAEDDATGGESKDEEEEEIKIDPADVAPPDEKEIKTEDAQKHDDL